MAFYRTSHTAGRLLFLCLGPLVFSLSAEASSSSSSETSWTGPLAANAGAKHPGNVGGDPDAKKTKSYDNSWCFRGLYDYDNCPERETLHDCVRCCYELSSYYNTPPSKNVCIASCSDQFPRTGSERLQF